MTTVNSWASTKLTQSMRFDVGLSTYLRYLTGYRLIWFHVKIKLF